MRSFKYLMLIGGLAIFLLLGCNWLNPFAPDCSAGSFCTNGVDIQFQGKRLASYSVQLQIPGEEPLIFSCPQPMTLYSLGSEEFPLECRSDGLSWISFRPEQVSVTINWTEGSVQEELRLKYAPVPADNPACPAQCERAAAAISFGNIGTPVAALIPTPTPTPIPIVSQIPVGKWSVAGEDQAGDWLVYETPSIYDLVLDGNVIWAGGSGGLLRWDRTTGDVTHFLAPQTPLPDNDVNDLLLHDGLLYIGTETAVAVYDRQNKWTIYPNAEMGLGEGSGNYLALADDELWVANKTGLARRSSDGQWQTIKAGPDTFELEWIDQIAAQDDGLYVAGSATLGSEENQVYRYADGKWEKVASQLPEGLPAPDGTWWKSDRYGVHNSRDKGATWQLAFDWEDYITLQTVDEQGRLYLTTDSDVLVFDDNRFTEAYRFTAVGPELNYINIIERDQQGRMWFATDGRGLSMYDGQRWRNWQPESRPDMKDDAIRGLAVTDKQVFAGASSAAGEGGVMIYDIARDRWSNFWPGESELSGGGVEGIAVNRRGQAYLPTASGILDIYDNGRWQHVEMPQSDGYILMTSEGVFDAEDNYWVGTAGLGLWKYDGKQWKVIDPRASGLSANTINALAFDGYEQLWALAGSGLAVRCGTGQWQEIPIPNISEHIFFGDVAVDPQNRIWVMANFDVLAVYNGQDWQVIPPDVVGESMWDDALAFDADGHPWISTSNGVAIFRGKIDLPAPDGPIADCTAKP